MDYDSIYDDGITTVQIMMLADYLDLLPSDVIEMIDYDLDNVYSLLKEMND